MLTASVVLAWVQQQSSGLGWTGDEARTWMLGLMTTMVGIALRLIWT
jgi:hypothetical protein